MRNLWISNLLCMLLLPMWARAQIPTSSADDAAAREAVMALGRKVEGVIRDLRAFQPDEALDRLEGLDLPNGMAAFFRGWARHQQGDYKQASKYLNMVTDADLLGDPYLTNRLDELRHTAEALAEFAVYESENFSIRYEPGRDKIMMFFLPDVLEQVYARYSSFFGFQREEKIIVELMPDHELFSYASALTRKQIETTGTIALCVENRLVAMTPRRVAMGYYWPDVIAHEFVHYILTKLSRDRVPLWMQEGVAKYFESRWDPEAPTGLDPSMETVLAMALEKGDLLTVQQMMPSFAALPTAEMAHRAYAQTATMIAYLSSLKGEEVLRRIFTGLRDTEGDMDQVMQTELGVPFDTFEADWRVWLGQQNYQKHKGLDLDEGLKLLDDDQLEEKVAATDVDDAQRKKHLRLGDLLLERHRYAGALKEYEKIVDPKAPASRQVVLRLITCYGRLNRHEDVIAVIDRHVPDLEADVTMLIHKAESQVALSRTVDAERLLMRALRYNPYNPGIYQLLVTLKDDDPEAVRKYQEAIKLLTGPPPAANRERKS